MTQQTLLGVRGCVLAGLFGSICFAAVVRADDAGPSTSLTARQLVQEALHREIYGLDQDRERLLSEAVRQDPQLAEARWHQGFVSYRGEWTRAQDIPALLAQEPKLAAYEQQRQKHADDLAGNLQMANWCRRQSLGAQERAHWTRVLDLDPDHRTARSRLGYRLVDGQWKTRAEVRDEVRQAEQRRDQLERWRGRIERLRNALRQPVEAKRALAEDAIRELGDPSAIPALEAVLTDSESDALVAVAAIAEMRGEQSVQALIRQAVLSRWDSVRHAAALALGEREMQSYVPMLLAEMYTPVRTQARVVPTGNNRFVYSHAFLREGQQQQQELVLNTRFRRLPRPGGDRNETLMRALARTMIAAMDRERQVAVQNWRAAVLNQRIAAALTVATGQQLAASPEAWWSWWNQDQDVVYQGEKQRRRIQRTTQVALVDRTPPSSQGGGIQISGSPQAGRAECFVAGTPVWTAAGARAIEAIRVGDLVLAQNPRSGELSYKPVLRTTVRAAEALTRIEAGEDTFQTSGGHLFWVAGEGWKKSRELRSGLQLHALGGSVPVYDVGKGTRAETFNLVVADFHTYFVGDSRVLSHDVTMQRPVEVLVPGLRGE